MTNADKAAYVERLTRWLMPDDDPELAAEARASMSLDGVYKGGSRRIMRMIRLAYLRGVRRGAAIAWNARQPVGLRTVQIPPPPRECPACGHVLCDAGCRCNCAEAKRELEAEPESPYQRLVWRYLELHWREQFSITKELGLRADVEPLSDEAANRLMFKRAHARGLLAQFWDEVERRHPDPADHNPFATETT